MKPALFIDRDGTISKDCPYCKNASEIKLYDDIYKPLSELSKTYYIIIITICSMSAFCIIVCFPERAMGHGIC